MAAEARGFLRAPEAVTWLRPGSEHPRRLRPTPPPAGSLLSGAVPQTFRQGGGPRVG